MTPTPPGRRRAGRITLAAATLSAFALVAACSGPPKQSASGDQSPFKQSDGTPAAKGEIDSFSWATYAEPPTLDYIQAFDYPQNTILSNVCESLMRWTPQLKEEPGLAEKAGNPDPTTWVFDLRAGVKFHDGGVMTADDVVFSLNRQLNPDNAAAWATVFQNVDTITKTGPLQVTVKLKTPDSQFPQYMATAAGVVASAQGVQAAGKDYGTAAASTAPAPSSSAPGPRASPSNSTASTTTGAPRPGPGRSPSRSSPIPPPAPTPCSPARPTAATSSPPRATPG
jgi:peptide/nickel transport system substrate-binding protein